MKSRLFLLFLILGVLLLSCNNDKKQTGSIYNIDNPISAENPDMVVNNANGASEIEFKETEYNFGVVIAGEKVSHSFVFKNTGTGNLVISNVKASCGCTVPKWPKEPVKPGETGIIEIVFDSTNRMGKQTKTATVYSNTVPNTNDLVIHCEVIK
jgi:hypothetical protein